MQKTAYIIIVIHLFYPSKYPINYIYSNFMDTAKGEQRAGLGRYTLGDGNFDLLDEKEVNSSTSLSGCCALRIRRLPLECIALCRRMDRGCLDYFDWFLGVGRYKRVKLDRSQSDDCLRVCKKERKILHFFPPHSDTVVTFWFRLYRNRRRFSQSPTAGREVGAAGLFEQDNLKQISTEWYLCPKSK